MRIRHSVISPNKIELQMTPMIDIVFQMLAFFIMTLKIVTIEGDFSVKMPPDSPQEGSLEDQMLPPMTVRLRADSEGELAGIQFADRDFPSFAALNQYVIQLVGSDRGPGSMADTAEVELDADFFLKYRYTMDAITAISGYVTPEGEVVKLIDKIRFSKPREGE